MSGDHGNCREYIARRGNGADAPDLPASCVAFDPLDAAAHSTGADNVKSRAPKSALLGDAAHAQPPNLGQGAGMAMQSGLSLATHMEKLTDRRDIPDRLAKWEAGERGLVDHCQKWSCLYGEIAFLPDEFRSRAIGQMMADPWIGDRLLRAARSEPTGTAAARRHAVDACSAQ
jgi:2-polyprenyl-6-methoxyphenol hydroxylase-like FAD-dependent oxidoreductase